MNEEVIKMTAELTAILARNSAGLIFDKVRSVKARKNDQETIKELEEIINNLLEDKNELMRISQALSQELASQKITAQEIKYITDNVIPLIEKFIPAEDENVENLKSLLSPEILQIMQVLGFNYKVAIGAPLTLMVQKFIESKIPNYRSKK